MDMIAVNATRRTFARARRLLVFRGWIRNALTNLNWSSGLDQEVMG